MGQLKANTVCKNINCHNGPDGGRKKYYACRYCVHTENWRAVACCPECYMAYMDQVAAARSVGKTVDTLPDRLDMTKEEVSDLILNTDLETVKKETVEELSDYMQDDTTSFIDAVDAVNLELDTVPTKKRNKKKV